jgi:hypothetical protein
LDGMAASPKKRRRFRPVRIVVRVVLTKIHALTLTTAHFADFAILRKLQHRQRGDKLGINELFNSFGHGYRMDIGRGAPGKKKTRSQKSQYFKKRNTERERSTINQ